MKKCNCRLGYFKGDGYVIILLKNGLFDEGFNIALCHLLEGSSYSPLEFLNERECYLNCFCPDCGNKIDWASLLKDF